MLPHSISVITSALIQSDDVFCLCTKMVSISTIINHAALRKFGEKNKLINIHIF